jgi:hypothetical protein
MALQFETLKNWVSENKNQSIKLPVHLDNLSRESSSSSSEGKTSSGSSNINSWEAIPIEPATPLSCILYITNPMYSLTPVGARNSLLREKCTELQSTYTNVLKGRKFPICKTAEAIIAACTGGSSACSSLGWKALCGLFGIQIVWFDETQKLLQFYPEELHTWTPEKPIYFFSCLANQVWNPPSNWKPIQLGLWLSDKENEGWRVKYEEADGTMEELKALGKELDVFPATKMLKADLCKYLGKAMAIKAIGKW